jgi:hypothetical protein
MKLNGGEHEPYGGVLDGFLEVLREPAVAAEPGECALRDSSPWMQLEAGCGVG